MDLEGTVTVGLIFPRCLWLLSVRRPWLVPLAPLHLLAGRARLKDFIARSVRLDAAQLRYRQDVLDFLRNERRSGRRLVLATAVNERDARAVADRLGLFDGVLASDRHTLLKGGRKLEAIRAHAAGPFDYMGDSRADLAVFTAARQVMLVSPSRWLLSRLTGAGKVARVCR